MPARSLCMLLGVVLMLDAAKSERIITDPRIEVRNLSYTNRGAQFDLENKAASAIVLWVAALGAVTTRGPGSRNVANGTCGVRGGGQGAPIESGGVRHAAVGFGSCGGAKMRRVSAIFADGSWAGDWSDLEGSVKFAAVWRLVAQRWLVSLRALEADPDPVARVGELVRLLEKIPGIRWTCPLPGCWQQPPEGLLRARLDLRGKVILKSLVMRCYDGLLKPDIRRWGERESKRDERAEQEFKSRPDAKELIQDTLAQQTARVAREINDVAWVTMFGPNGERVGPAAASTPAP